jgi:hypothetical protein
VIKLKPIIPAILFFIYFTIPFTSVFGADISNSLSFKATVLMDGVEKEWEYINPDEYEVETGMTVLKGEQAMNEVISIFKTLRVSENAEVERMLQVLKAEGYDNIERLDVRWIDKNDRLFTWFWEKG